MRTYKDPINNVTDSVLGGNKMQKGPPSSGLDVDFEESKRKELLGLLKAAGVTPSNSDDGQLVTAVENLVSEAIESTPSLGTSASGSWVKWQAGFLVCYGVSSTPRLNGANQITGLVTFPQVFSGIPVVVVSISRMVSQAETAGPIAVTSISSSSAEITKYGYFGVSPQVIAIGRWK